jgi:hypothetical protein
LLLLLFIILFLPFPATISASTVVTESKGLDIRASEEAIITQLNAEGPSEKKVPKGFRLMTLSSPELQASYDSTKEEIYTLDAQIRAAKIQLRSLESGSAVLTTKSRDDELAIALADEKRYAAEVASFKEQLDLVDQTIKSYAELVKSGAVSELQLRTWLTTKEQLIGQLASAQGNLNSARATINRQKEINMLIRMFGSKKISLQPEKPLKVPPENDPNLSSPWEASMSDLQNSRSLCPLTGWSVRPQLASSTGGLPLVKPC